MAAKRAAKKTRAKATKARKAPAPAKRSARKKATKSAKASKSAKATRATKPAKAKPGKSAKKVAKRSARSARSTSAKKSPRTPKVAKRGFRLPESVRPSHYALHIRVDPALSREYSGVVTIDLELTRATDRIELHASEMQVTEATVRVGDESWTADVEPQSEHESVIVVSPKRVAAGQAQLQLVFASTLRGDLRGLYGASAGERQYAFSQLEAADARRFFPCFDEPAFKARFSVSVTTASRNGVVSNGPIERREDDIAGEETTTYFRTTPLLSTYLVALAVGELEFSEPVYANGVPIRIVHTPGNAHLTGFALDAARESLTRLADYFGVPYAYEKLDLVAVPDFEIGAMENAGAVFFRETLLLVDERSVSLAEKKRAAEVIAHELAHMWYGNLVTMRWWDDLWLNEAFATWMAFDIVAKWRPEWHMWNDFGHARNSALHLDALDNTHPIYTPVQTPAEATQNFDLITYEKGAAVVRMLERYLGPSTFQTGVRTYIERHRESNTQASDLWRALGEAAGESVEKVVRPFIEQPGFPLVRVRTSGPKSGGFSVELEQQRFTARGPTGKNGNGSHKATRWVVPWVGRVDSGSESHNVRAVLSGRRATVEVGTSAPDFVYGNADEGGFFRPLHPLEDLPSLLRALPKLSTSERLGFVHHQWALVRANYLELAGFLPLFQALAGETDADVLRALLGPAEVLIDDIAEEAGGDTREQLQTLLARTFGAALSAVGFDAAEDESDAVRLRRAELVTLCAVIAEDPSAIEAVEARAVAYLDDRSAIDANLVGSVLSIGARQADRARLARYLEASQTDATPQERRRFRMSIADVRDPELVQEVLRATLTPAIPTQDVALVLARLIGNRTAREATFEFVQAHWAELRERMPAMLVSRLVDALPALRTEAHRKQMLAFFATNPLPTAARALRQADERFRLATTFRKHAVPALRRWLSQFSQQ